MSAEEWADRIQNVILDAQREGHMLWISDDAQCECAWAEIRLGGAEDPGTGGVLVMEWRRPT
ncbi:hypothetical protein ACIO1C_29530 [Streptomyces sp. NPDC087420]|uniref:hypothetical protein n=1 Tax=Streptomyces sp. NPDC087420 TaxID=3365785 RepID=UPI0038384D5B